MEILMNNEQNKIAKYNQSNNLTILLDKLFKNVFDPSKNSKNRRVFEGESKTAPCTVITFEFFHGSLNQFDKLVFCVAISEQRAGNNFFTVRRLWHKLGGGHKLTDDIKELISDSLKKLRCTLVNINMTQVNKKFHYTDKAEVTFSNYLLPCKTLEVKINGQLVDGAYQFLDTSPILQVAELKNQFTEQPFELLDVPKLKNTEVTMKLKFYLLERITAILGSHKKHKSHIVGKKKGGGFIFKKSKILRKIITFDDIFHQCELADATKRQKQQARETISKILEHFKAEKFISEWHFEKKNGAFYSIHFK